MDDSPDIYTDGFSVTIAPFGCTLTLKRSYHDDAGGAEARVVGRIRMTKELLLDLSRIIYETVTAAAAAAQQTTKPITH